MLWNRILSSPRGSCPSSPDKTTTQRQQEHRNKTSAGTLELNHDYIIFSTTGFIMYLSISPYHPGVYIYPCVHVCARVSRCACIHLWMSAWMHTFWLCQHVVPQMICRSSRVLQNQEAESVASTPATSWANWWCDVNCITFFPCPTHKVSHFSWALEVNF